MIRAHLATFPPRRRILRGVVDAILPQVDHLFVVLNDYDKIPGYLQKDPRITAVIPDRDVKDAGKFWFAPEPTDIVFTIDDDIGYPPDYVSRTLELIRPLGFEGQVFAHHGNAWQPAGGPDNRGEWQNYLFRYQHDEITGASIVGTGALCARGDAIPPLSEIEPFAGACDLAYNRWLSRRGILSWILPRDAEWMTNDLPHNLWKTSLLVTVARARHPQHLACLQSFAFDRPHANQRYHDYHALSI